VTAAGKTEAIHFYEGDHEDIFINQVDRQQAIIKSVPEHQAMRILGYWLTKDFNWNEHIRVISNKALKTRLN